MLASLMRFATVLQEGLFLRRYKRFFADIQLGETTIVAHVPNTGSLKGLVESERPCLVSVSDNPKRKLKHTLEMIRSKEDAWVGVNTAHPTLLVRELWEQKKLPHWTGFDGGRPEVKISPESRIDWVLWNSQTSFARDEKLGVSHCQQSEKALHFVEIKNVTLNDGAHALFPDCESLRAQKHVRELMTVVKAGHTAEFLFIVQREDCHSFRPCHELDPEYARLLRQARDQGVRLTALSCALTPEGIDIKVEPLTVLL